MNRFNMIKHAVPLETNQLIVNSKHNLHPETNWPITLNAQQKYCYLTSILNFPKLHPIPCCTRSLFAIALLRSYPTLSSWLLVTQVSFNKLFGGILMLHNILLIYYKVLVNVNYVIKQTDEMTDYEVNLKKTTTRVSI